MEAETAEKAQCSIFGSVFVLSPQCTSIECQLAIGILSAGASSVQFAKMGKGKTEKE